MRPIGIDLFSGVGGLSLGFEQAGCDVVAAVEIDPIHAAAHKFNFPKCEVIPRSITEVTGSEIRRKANIAGDVDVVFGGAPCQGFSMIGKRSLEDPRNLLVSEFVRIVSELDANYFVFENVKGLTVGRQKKFLEELISTFQELEYDLLLPWRVLNAADFGVPQSRQRLFLIGCKQGLHLPSYPTGSGDLNEVGREDVKFVTCSDAISDLPEAEEFHELLKDDSILTSNWGQPSEFASRMRCLSNDAWGFGYLRNFNRDLLTASLRTNHTDISRERFENTAEGMVEPVSRFFKLNRNGQSNTLRAGTDSSRGAFTSPRPIHYSRPRCVTVREMARLHSFPDWFRFHKTKWHGARQIGNAVPPLLAMAVATKIIEAIGVKPTRPKEVLELENSELLEMDMSNAAKFWNVTNPIGRRDKKSGD